MQGRLSHTGIKPLLIISGLLLFFLSSCTKNCPNLLDGPINDEEKKYYLGSAHTFMFANQYGDTDYVYADEPRFKIIPVENDECERPGNQAVNQLWRLPDGIHFDAFFQHDNGRESSQYLTLSLNAQPVFRYNIIRTSFVTIEINTQFFRNTLVDSTSGTTLSPDIRTVWYGKHTGILQYEKWNGEIWSRQRVVN